MRFLITAGPTREYIDSVRFITNASSGRMGYAVAAAAVEAGHEVTLLSGPVDRRAPSGCKLRRFVSTAELADALREHFPRCDVLVMAAAVGDFRVEKPAAGKLRRGGGSITLRLLPTQDVLASVSRSKRPDQRIVAFAVEAGPQVQAEASARSKLTAKRADLIVVNSPGAMAATRSRAAILSADGIVLPWARRTKRQLARRIVSLVESPGKERSQ